MDRNNEYMAPLLLGCFASAALYLEFSPKLSLVVLTKLPCLVRNSPCNRITGLILIS